jgi:hypothetical protein
MSELHCDKIDEIMYYCLFHSQQEADDLRASGRDVVASHGIIQGFGFHPDRLQEKKEEIKALVIELVPNLFLRPTGGKGTTFLYLPTKEDGGLWGEHRNAEALFVLAQALGWAGFCLPRHLWGVFQNGMPYVWFNDLKVTEESQEESDGTKAEAAVAMLTEVLMGSTNPMKSITEKFKAKKAANELFESCKETDPKDMN